MRGLVNEQPQLFYQMNVEEMIPEGHPIRPVKALVDEALSRMSVKLDWYVCRYGPPRHPARTIIEGIVTGKDIHNSLTPAIMRASSV